MKVIEGTIQRIAVETGEIRISNIWYAAGPGLIKQAKEHFPPGTDVKASVEGYTIKSLVKQGPELIS